MAEMGFSGAIVYNLYKPLADGDVQMVSALLNYYKSVYRKIGLAMLFAGTVLLPFIPKIIHGEIPDNINIYVLYYLYLANSTVSYFLFAYKTSLLEASQRSDVVKTVYTTVTAIRYVLQILAILLFKNYYLFVVLMIVGTAAMNVFTAVASRRMFPMYSCRGDVSAEMKADIKTRVKGLVVGTVSRKTFSTFDSIVISSIVGLVSVAIYNNYFLIYSSVYTFMLNIKTSMQASVGNSVAVESQEKNYKDLLLFQFLFSVLAVVLASVMSVSYQPFMALWMGEGMLLKPSGAFLFCAWFVVCVPIEVQNLYSNAKGLWWESRYCNVAGAIFNIVANYFLCRLLGVYGVVLASVLSYFSFSFVWQAAILFKHYFRMSCMHYLLKQGFYFGQAAASSALSWWLCSFVRLSGAALPGNAGRLWRFAELGLRGCVAALVSVFVLFACNFRTQVWKNAGRFLRAVLRRG